MRWVASVGAALVLAVIGGGVFVISRSPPPATYVAHIGWMGCAEDGDCERGSICHTHIRPRGGPIRACRYVGPRGEGEHCNAPPQEIDEACRAALNCNYGFCGRPCRLDDPKSCPTGSLCREEDNAASCVQNCREGNCGPGERCIGIDDQLSACGVATGDCDRTGCPTGQLCQRTFFPPEIHLRCIQPCAADGGCERNGWCHHEECLERCDVRAQNCPPDFTCGGTENSPGTYCYPPL